MQIVIDIPEEEYKCVQITGCIGNKTCISNAIYNGLPLPKYGRLIDADEEIQQFCNKVCGHTLEECGYGSYCPFVQRMISAPTIIEADKGDTE